MMTTPTSFSAATRGLRRSLAAGLIGIGLFAGCDGVTNAEGDAVVTGTVTDDAGYGKQAGRVESAAVTAARVDGEGRTSTLSGTATTDAEGRYTLDLEESSDVVVVTAQKADFTSRVLVATDGEARVRALPMTTESRVEADVYVAARGEADGEAVSLADVAAYVDARTAASVAAGSSTTARLAAAVAAAAAAADEVVEEEEGEEATEAAAESEFRAYLRLQANAEVGTDEDDAEEDFRAAYLAAYTEADVEVSTRARARQAARAAIVRFSNSLTSDARFALRQQAELDAAIETSSAIEAAFREGGASQARIAALAEARAELLAELRAASDQGDLDDARDDYERDVEAELRTAFDVTAVQLTATEAALTGLRSTLSTSVSAAAGAGAIATAYTTFYTSAEAAVRSTLPGAEAAGRVVVLLAAQ